MRKKILLLLATSMLFSMPTWAESSLRFYGHGTDYIDRVEISVDPQNALDTATTGDFTFEWWMKANAADNTSGSCPEWICGNILLDRDIFPASGSPAQKFGVSLFSTGGVGYIRFGGGSSNTTIQGTINVADNIWHHVAVTRQASDGNSCIFIDGIPDTCGNTNTGDKSYPDGQFEGSDYGLSTADLAVTNKNPYLVIGAEKHDYCQHVACSDSYPSYNGFFDELRVSDTLRYTGAFTAPTASFVTDSNTKALYHFNENFGASVDDSSGADLANPANGSLQVGGAGIAGPEWVGDSPFTLATATETPTETATETFTNTATETFTETPTETSTETFTNTATETFTETPTETSTETFTNTSTETFTETPTETSTETFTDTSTETFTESPTETLTEILTNTATFTATTTKKITETAVETATFTETPTETTTETATATETVTGTSVATETTTVTATGTTVDTATNTETPTHTVTETTTQTATPTTTETSANTNTATSITTETVTSTTTNTITPSATATNTTTATVTTTGTSFPSTQTQTATTTNTPTTVPTKTPVQTVNTATYTFTPSITNTATVTNTPTVTITPISSQGNYIVLLGGSYDALIYNTATSIEPGGQPQIGYQYVMIRKNGIPVATLRVNFDQYHTDLDWKNFFADYLPSSSGNKAVMAINDAQGVQDGHTLYIKKGTAQIVGICPNAKVLTDVMPGCTGIYYVTTQDTDVSIQSYNGEDYWTIHGLHGTGGFETTAAAINSLTPTATPAASGSPTAAADAYTIDTRPSTASSTERATISSTTTSISTTSTNNGLPVTGLKLNQSQLFGLLAMLSGIAAAVFTITKKK
ncbi:MAG: LamG-like jellyroll fold domain-containing protein [bacterium]